MFWEMVCLASHTNLRTTRNMNLFILTLAIMLLLVRMRIPVNSGSVWCHLPGFAVLLQWNHFRSRQLLSALSHGTRHQLLWHTMIPTCLPWLCFVLSSNIAGRFVRISGASWWGVTLQRPEGAVVADGSTWNRWWQITQETEPGLGPEALLSITHSPEIHSLETAPGPSREAQGSGPGLDGGDRRPDADTAALQLQLEISSSIFIGFTHFTTFLFCWEQHLPASQRCHAPACVLVSAKGVGDRGAPKITAVTRQTYGNFSKACRNFRQVVVMDSPHCLTVLKYLRNACIPQQFKSH